MKIQGAAQRLLDHLTWRWVWAIGQRHWLGINLGRKVSPLDVSAVAGWLISISDQATGGASSEVDGFSM